MQGGNPAQIAKTEFEPLVFLPVSQQVGQDSVLSFSPGTFDLRHLVPPCLIVTERSDDSALILFVRLRDQANPRAAGPFSSVHSKT
jgi:hypothetical protein